MRPLRRSRWISAIIALLIAGAWMAASNHCALAAISVADPHACCHGKSSGNPAAPPAAECCQAFNVPVPEHLSAPVAEISEVPGVGTASLAGPAPAHADRVFIPPLATGPPPAVAFAESVLNASLFAHAPPFSGRDFDRRIRPVAPAPAPAS